ncbi:competence protein CoiA family protein [Streptomyces albidoflavus]
MPYSEADDTRKVQTAVTYGAESDQPVFLPYAHDNFDRFMRGRTRDDFYCGVLLGGCGAKLSPKRYLDKKCHFAHRSPVHCHRTEVGESSADHLYIGQAIADWLKQQDRQASRPAYKPHGHQVRDVVDVPHDGGRRLVRVQLARRSKHEWEAEDAKLRLRHVNLDWFFGPDSLVANWQMERQGYALRVQCRSVGASRVVEVGAQFPEMAVEWTSLSACTLTPDGILTPGLIRTPDGIVPRHAVTSEPRLAIPSASFLITEATPTHTTATHRWFDTTLRVTARLSLPARAASPEGQHTYRPTNASLSIDGDGTWVIQAQSLEQAQATAHARPRASTSSPAAPPSPSAEQQALPPEANLVASFRATMENAASNGKVVTTTALYREAALRDRVLSAEQWVRLLLAVEQPRTPGKPVLCALIKGSDGGPAPFFREVLHGIGWTRDFSSSELLDIWLRERRRVLAAYGSARRAMLASSSAPSAVLAREHRPPARTKATSIKGDPAFDALLDIAHEAQRSTDLDTRERILWLAEQEVPSTDAHEVLNTLTDWLIDQRADELYDTWERLSALVDALNRDGDDLHADELRRILRNAKELAEEVGADLASAEYCDIRRWQQHLTELSDRLTLTQIRGHAVAVRVALRQNARAGRTTTWGGLSRKIGVPLAALHPDDKVAVLVEADRETRDDKPLLSTLIAAHGGVRPHSLYPQVLFILDRPVPRPSALFMHWRMALHQHSELR